MLKHSLSCNSKVILVKSAIISLELKIYIFWNFEHKSWLILHFFLLYFPFFEAINLNKNTLTVPEMGRRVMWKTNSILKTHWRTHQNIFPSWLQSSNFKEFENYFFSYLQLSSIESHLLVYLFFKKLGDPGAKSKKPKKLLSLLWLLKARRREKNIWEEPEACGSGLNSADDYLCCQELVTQILVCELHN